jgi:hypothetical protein
VGKLDMFAGWDENRDHPYAQILDRNWLGDQDRSGSKGWAHAPRQYGTGAKVVDDHGRRQRRRPNENQDGTQERDGTDESANWACFFSAGECHEWYFDPGRAWL